MEMVEGQMKVWITYARENEDFVSSIKKQLQNANLEIVDYENGIMPGDTVVNSIYKSMLSADVMLAILPPKEIAKPWFYYELGLFTGQIQNNSHKRIIPIVPYNNSYIPQFINQYQYLDLTDDNNSNEQVEKLIEMLKLLSQREILLENEQIDYKRKNKKRQISLYMTLITTIMATFVTIFTFIFASESFFSFNINRNTILVMTSTAIAVFIGVIISITLEQLKKK
jgi:hypothetical protein